MMTRAELLHGIRWSKTVQDLVLEHVENLPAKTLLVGIMDAIFKLEAAQKFPGTQTAQMSVAHALDDLCKLLEPPPIIDVLEE